MTNFQIETNETIKYDLIINGSSAGLTGKFKPPSDLLLLDKKTFYDLIPLAEAPFVSGPQDIQIMFMMG